MRTNSGGLSEPEAMIHGQVEAFEDDHALALANINRCFIYAALHWRTINHSRM